MILSLIAAVGEGYEIGYQGKIPWHIPEDLKFFRDTTRGHPVVMGRKTFESIGSKPLPHRRNIVISSNPDAVIRSAPALTPVECVKTLKEALSLLQNEPGEVFICGGGALYLEALNSANRLYLTRVKGSYKADAYFPKFDEKIFTRTSLKELLTTPPGLAQIEIWERKSPAV